MNKPRPTIKQRASIVYEQLPTGAVQLRIIAAGPPYGRLGDHVTQLTYKQLFDLNIIQHIDLFVYMFDRRSFDAFYANDILKNERGI